MTHLIGSLRDLLKPPQQQASGYFHWLDLVRGCAALAILVWHYQHFYYQAAGNNPIVYNRDVQPFYGVLSLLYNDGYFAVQMFWVISGFVFSSVYAAARVSGREFFTNRFARLYPLHFATLLLVAGLQALSFHLQQEFQIYPYNDLYHFVLHLFFVSHWGLEAGDSFNAPIWSVSVEVFIYILFWLLLKYVFRLGIVGPLALMTLFGAFIVFKVPGVFWECGMFFFAGAAVYVWLTAFRQHNSINMRLGLLGMMVSIGLLVMGVQGMGDMSRVILFSSLVLLSASLDIHDTRRRVRSFSRLGDLTYGLYLLHVPTQISLILLMDQLGVDRSIVSTRGFFVFFMVLMIVLAALCYRYFELPARGWLRARFRKPAPAVEWQAPAETRVR